MTSNTTGQDKRDMTIAYKTPAVSENHQQLPAKGLAWIGSRFLAAVNLLVFWISIIYTVLFHAFQPRHWPRTVKNVFSRKLFDTSIRMIIPVGFVAFLVGAAVVMQAQLWLGKLGQTAWFGPLFVAVVVRELAPLLTNLVMIIYYGSKIVSELAGMTVSGSVRMLDAQGIDPLTYLVMPRMTAMAVSTFSLSIMFIVFSIASGYVFSFILGFRVLSPEIFLDRFLRALELRDILSLLAASLIPPLFTSVICCTEGLNDDLTRPMIPAATSRALSRSTVCLFFILISITVLTYL